MFGLDKNIIHPISKGSGTFEDLKNTALEGSDYNNREEDIEEENNYDNNEDNYYYPEYNGNLVTRFIGAANPIVIPMIFIFIASIFSMIMSGIKNP